MANNTGANDNSVKNITIKASIILSGDAEKATIILLTW